MKAAFSELALAHRSGAVALLTKRTGKAELAEDIVQQALANAWINFGSLTSPLAFKSWLYNIALNELASYGRKSVNKPTSELVYEPPCERLTADRKLADSELGNIVKTAMYELDPRAMQAVVLRELEDMSFGEVAASMGCKYDTAKANYRHGILKLRTKLREAV